MTVMSPRPTYPANMPVDALRVAELVLVTTLRLFVAVEWQRPGPAPDWRGGLQAAGIAPAGADSFLALCRFLAVAARRPLDLRCPHCATLGRDEILLLRLISLLQHGRHADAQAILQDWLPPTGARMAMLPAQGLATAFRKAGLVVLLRHPEAATQPHGMPRFPDRGLALVQ